MAQNDEVRQKLVALLKDHFRIRREPGQTMPLEQWKQLTNGFLYGIQHTLDIVGGHPDEAKLAAELRLHVNRDEVDEANAMVDAL